MKTPLLIALITAATAVSSLSGQWTSQPFGSGWIHRGPGGQSITSQPFGSGWIHRGEASALFSNSAIADRFPEDAWVDAAAERDTHTMMNLAWLLEGIEKRLNQKDDQTTAAALFEATAKMAAAQGNVEILGELVRLHPASRAYLDEANAAGATRGERFISGMPSLVRPSFDEDGNLRALGRGQVHFLDPVFVLLEYSESIGWAQASSIASTANMGRLTNSPRMIAAAASDLAQFESARDVASDMLEEASELAIELNDQASLEFIAALWQASGPLANDEKGASYRQIAGSLGTTRGMVDFSKFYAPQRLPWSPGTQRLRDMLDDHRLPHMPYSRQLPY